MPRKERGKSIVTRLQETLRDQRPHKAAVVALFLFSWRFSKSVACRSRAMEFWDGLTNPEQELCRTLLKRIDAAPTEEEFDAEELVSLASEPASSVGVKDAHDS